MNIKVDLIGNIVAEDFRTAAIFKKYGIDFCCKGGRTIEDACTAKNIHLASIYHELEQLPKGESNSIDFNSFPLDLLADYIEKIHHRYVTEQLPILQEFLNKVCKVHGERHPELLEVNALFDGAAQELLAHLKKEESILFPFIKDMVKAKIEGKRMPSPHFGTVENPIHMMMNEHSVEGERLAKIAKLTEQYTAPADACTTYRVVFEMLQDFENDLHKHIHLENNILFPKSIQLEKEMCASA